jgi:hypothetical protein
MWAIYNRDEEAWWQTSNGSQGDGWGNLMDSDGELAFDIALYTDEQKLDNALPFGGTWVRLSRQEIS